MKQLPVALQLLGLGALGAGVLILFGLGWCVLVAGASTTLLGTLLELERKS